MKSRDQIVKALAAHYSAELKGKVWAAYDETKRQYSIRGENLPAHPDLASLYPNGWSLLSYIKPSQARQLLETKLSKASYPIYRVKFVIDEDACFEESNGEARPMTEAEYKGNEYRACPKHPRGGTKVIDASVSPNVAGCAICGNTNYEDIPYQEYLAYYGNPDRHIYLGCIVETQCDKCSAWKVKESLWHIDFMDNDKAYLALALDRWMTEEEAKALPEYAGEVAKDLISN
jgi:hypothetical protein